MSFSRRSNTNMESEEVHDFLIDNADRILRPVEQLTNYSRIVQTGEEGAIKQVDNTNPKDTMGSQKDPLSLLTREFVHGTARAMRYGAFEAKRKDGGFGYGPYNWRSTEVRFSIYLDAILRHTIALADGEEIDPDSGLPHEDHIAANINIIKDAKKHNVLIDDRLARRIS